MQDWLSNIEKRLTLRTLILICGLTALLAYWPVATFSFFWEDPFDIGQEAGYTLWQLLTLPVSNAYYRPVWMVLMRVLRLGGEVYHPLVYQSFAVIGHMLASGLLFLFCYRLYKNRFQATAAALIFATTPLFLDGIRAGAPHPLLTSMILAAMIIYLNARESSEHRKLWWILPFQIIALGLHENGVILPALFLMLEGWLLLKSRIKKLNFWWLSFGIPSLLYLVIWASIPRTTTLIGQGLTLKSLAYFSQSISYPFAELLSLPGEGGAGIAILLTLIVFGITYRLRRLTDLLPGLVLWFLAMLPAWFGLPFDYLEVSPRVLYLPAVGAAMMWSGAIIPSPPSQEGRTIIIPCPPFQGGRTAKPQGGKSRLYIGILGVVLILLLNATTLNSQIRLYRAGSTIMKQSIAAAEDLGEGSRILYINLPDRLRYEDDLYPLGYWGMLTAPVSLPMSDFVEFSSGVEVETRSAGAFTLLGDSMEEAGYFVNPRGGYDYDPARLYEDIRWADQVFIADYRLDGTIDLRALGSVDGGGGASDDVDLWVEEGLLHVTIRWSVQSSLAEYDTIFVHVINIEGALVAQQDGDSIGGLYPLHLWQVDDLITDYRIVDISGLPPGRYAVAIGMYNRVSGDRLGEPFTMTVEIP